MPIDRSSPTLCFVHSVSDPDEALALIESGREGWKSLDIVQVRGKDLSPETMEQVVGGWVEAVSDLPTLVVVNDRLDVALATGADGVHLGQDDAGPQEARDGAPKDLLIGVSTHDRQEILLAQGAGASYVGLGAFYPSRTKPEARVLDPWKAGLMETIPALSIPVLGIGGINGDRVADVLALPPVTGIAVSEAIQGAEDPGAAAEDLRAAMDAAWIERPEHVL
jgi:thiamine-phosphate pyrophosphorylase